MTALDVRAERIRQFNRFYTTQIGVLEEGLLQSPFSLAEARVIYEIANTPRPAAGAVGKRLKLDPGYLSRIVQRLMRAGVLRRVRSEQDGRERILSLTAKGRAQFASLNRRSHEAAAHMLGGIPVRQQAALVEALDAAQTILDPASGAPAPAAAAFTLRAHVPGDMGWVVQKHGEVYCGEYGWNLRIEALVARVVADFLDRFDPARERCWIAERVVDGELQRIGSIFLVRKSATVAKLRLLLVTREARGLGLGKRLVEECIAFARQCGYRQVLLWTQSNLHAARGIYQANGFELIEEEKQRDFGPELTAQTWRLYLTASHARKSPSGSTSSQ